MPRTAPSPSWLSQHGVAIASIFGGALIYGLTRLWYVAFYGEFGVEPEDVGLGSSAILARAIPIALIGAFVFLIAAVALTALFNALSKPKGTSQPPTKAMGVPDTLLVAINVVFLAVFVGLPDAARYQADAVRRGDEVRATGHRLSRASFSNVLGLNVRDVDISWRDKDRRPVKLGTNAHMLLGSSSHEHFVYDVELERTLRLPRDLVVIHGP